MRTEFRNQEKTFAILFRANLFRVTLDRSFSYRCRLQSLRKKVMSRVTLLQRLAGISWDTGADSLRTATLSLVHFVFEYCSPAWCRSAHNHHIDVQTNNDSRIVMPFVELMWSSYQSSMPSHLPSFVAK